MKKGIFAAGAAIAAFAFAPAANAACPVDPGCQQVSGTVVSSTLNFGTVLAVAPLATLTPGQTSTGTGTMQVISVGPWDLKVKDESALGTAGHLLAGAVGCTNSASSLASPLSLYPTAVGGLDTFTTTFGDGAGANPAPYTLTGSLSPSIGHGTATDTVSIHYSQPVGNLEQLQSLCSYSLNAVYQLS